MLNKLNNVTLFSYVLVAVLIFFVYAIVTSGKSEITAYAYHKLDVCLTDEGKVKAVELYQSRLPHMLTWHDYDNVLRPYMKEEDVSEDMDRELAISWLKQGSIMPQDKGIESRGG